MIYLPSYFAETELNELHDLIEEYSFGTLIAPTPSGELAVAHLPFLLDREKGEKGTLLTHVARANKIFSSFDGSVTVLAIFQGAHGYISPNWYESDDNVPTWNYAVAHAIGSPKTVSEAGLHSILKRLTEKHEASQAEPWRIEDLPQSQWDRFKREIVGIEIQIDELIGKFKLSQNRGAEDREGAIAGVASRGGPVDVELARLMKERHARQQERERSEVKSSA